MPNDEKRKSLLEDDRAAAVQLKLAEQKADKGNGVGSNGNRDRISFTNDNDNQVDPETCLSLNGEGDGGSRKLQEEVRTCCVVCNCKRLYRERHSNCKMVKECLCKDSPGEVWRERYGRQQCKALGCFSVLAGAVLTVLLYFYRYEFFPSVNGEYVGLMSCRSLFWDSRQCGLDGTDCMPFTSGWNNLRCGICTYYNEFLVGDNPYRPDSYICKAAQHSGAVGKMGGCLQYRFAGPQPNFTKSCQHGICSTGQPFYFPKSVEMRSVQGSNCDQLSPVLIFALTGLTVLFLLCWLVHPSKPVLVSYMLVFGHFYVPFIEMNQDNTDWLARSLSSIFMVSMYIYFFYHYVLRHSMFDAPLWASNFFFYVIPYFVGCTMNTIFQWFLPIYLTSSIFETLTASQIVGGVVLFLLLIIAVVYHLNLICRTDVSVWGQQVRVYVLIFLYFMWGSLLMGPDFSMHLHHNYVATGLLPLTAFRGENRPKSWRGQRIVSTCQALMLGMFINGYSGSIYKGWDNGWEQSQAGSSQPRAPPISLFYGSYNETTANVQWADSRPQGAIGWDIWVNDVRAYHHAFNYNSSRQGMVPGTKYTFSTDGFNNTFSVSGLGENQIVKIGVGTYATFGKLSRKAALYAPNATAQPGNSNPLYGEEVWVDGDEEHDEGQDDLRMSGVEAFARNDRDEGGASHWWHRLVEAANTISSTSRPHPSPGSSPMKGQHSSVHESRVAEEF